MELKFWIWLIIVVAMFLIQRMRKAPGSPSGQRPAGEAPPERPLTFEEVMREIDQAQGRKPETPPVVQKQDYVDYDDEVVEEEVEREVVPAKKDTAPRADDQSLEIYERAKQAAFERPSLEETMKVEDTVVKFSHFKGYDAVEEKPMTIDILSDFKDPDGFRRAFIMSEILKRKF